ncbi:MAG: hypothetical protein MJY74_03880 [Bacteroidaceae bacterium]|nr:hypothetical protein [Bacteroidaceae bacterium]
MKTIINPCAILVAIVSLVSCGSTKNISSSSYTSSGQLKPAVESTIATGTSLEGTQTRVETVKLQGIEMSEALSEDGTQMIMRPFKWYAGIGKADNKQMAIELAQREAYATISRIFTNAVKDEAERGNVANNGAVQQALTSHWEQFSASLQKGCEPFGNTSIEYDQATRMYTATSKVGIRGDRFNQLLNTAGNFKPSNLSGAELEQFIEVNKSIMEAAKGN